MVMSNNSKTIIADSNEDTTLQELDDDWARQITEVRQSIDSGLLPESEEAQALAWRWMRLFRDTCKNNPILAVALRNLQECKTFREFNGITPGMLAWIAKSFVNARMTLFARHLSHAEVEEVRNRQMAHISDWPPLISEMRKQFESNAKVSDPAVQALAHQWQDLFRTSYCGDDQELENKVRAAFLHEPDLMLGIGTDLSLSIFVQKAIMFLHRPKYETANAGPKPSAQSVATLRAAHQLLDSPLILKDPIALSILGSEDEAALRDNPEQHNNPMAKALRTSVVVRSRLAEDEWEKAAQNGAGQYVILGAGLDTYAYRRAHHTGRIFEVDLPDTQQWKRDCLRAAGIRIPDCLTYVPLDFEHFTLEQALSQAGLRKENPAFFSWLGVAVYLEEEAFMNTLRFIASCASGSAVVFDYLIPPSTMTQVERIGFETISSAIAERGEHFKTFLEPTSLAGKLHSLGFSEANNLSPEHLHERYLSGRTDGLRLGGVSRLMHAVV
jgi:methyltransferase (TIGR00027 family)